MPKSLIEYLNDSLTEAVASRRSGKYNEISFDFDYCNFNKLIEYLKLSSMDKKDCGKSLVDILHSASYSDSWKAFNKRFEELKDTYGLYGDFWCSELVPNYRYVYVFKMGDEKVYTVTFSTSGRSIMYIRVDDLDKRTVNFVKRDKTDRIKEELEKIFS